MSVSSQVAGLKRILLIATGGTIASLLSDHGLKPVLYADELLSYIPEICSEYRIEAVQICTIDSSNMTTSGWGASVAASDAH